MSLRVDPAVTPVSRRGSWINAAWLGEERKAPLGPGLYLRSHRSRPLISRELFRLHAADSPAAGSEGLTARPGEFAWSIPGKDGAGPCRIEAVFGRRSDLRIRSNAAFVLEAAFESFGNRRAAAHAAAFSDAPGRAVVNAKAWLRRYGLEAVRGSLELDASWDGEMVTTVTIRIEPDASGVAELAMEEFWSTWAPADRPDFEDLRTQVREEWSGFLDAFPSLPDGQRRTGEAAAALLWMCAQGPDGLMGRESIFMSLNWMDSVWSWDNWLNMTGLAAAHPKLAFDQFRLMADHQDEHGAYPDAVNDGYRHYNFSKPPVQGLIARYIEASVPAFWTGSRIAEALDSVGCFTRWWLDHRRDKATGLCVYHHGNDSGWDNGTLMKEGILLISPDLNALLAVQCDVLADWAERTGNTGEAGEWRTIADELSTALVRELWDGGRFVGRLPDGRIVRSLSLAVTVPAILGDRLPEDIRDCLAGDMALWETPLGLATESPSSPGYEEENYWRGPIWAPSTLIAIIGQRALGRETFAGRIRDRFLALVEKQGFAECFNAETGAPLDDPAYTWTAGVYLALAAEEAS